MLTLQALENIEGTNKSAGPFGTMPQEPQHPGKGAKSNCIIQHNCREVHTYTSYKTTRIWENFNNRGTKMSLLQPNYVLQELCKWE